MCACEYMDICTRSMKSVYLGNDGVAHTSDVVFILSFPSPVSLSFQKFDVKTCIDCMSVFPIGYSKYLPVDGDLYARSNIFLPDGKPSPIHLRRRIAQSSGCQGWLLGWIG